MCSTVKRHLLAVLLCRTSWSSLSHSALTLLSKCETFMSHLHHHNHKPEALHFIPDHAVTDEIHRELWWFDTKAQTWLGLVERWGTDVYFEAVKKIKTPRALSVSPLLLSWWCPPCWWVYSRPGRAAAVESATCRVCDITPVPTETQS